MCVFLNKMVFLLLSLAFGSLPCLAKTHPCDVKSTSCIDLSLCRPSSRPRVLLKAPTLAEMEEMSLFEVSLRRDYNNSWRKIRHFLKFVKSRKQSEDSLQNMHCFGINMWQQSTKLIKAQTKLI